MLRRPKFMGCAEVPVQHALLISRSKCHYDQMMAFYGVTLTGERSRYIEPSAPIRQEAQRKRIHESLHHGSPVQARRACKTRISFLGPCLSSTGLPRGPKGK